MTEIDLCGICSCQEILRRNGRGQSLQGAMTKAQQEREEMAAKAPKTMDAAIAALEAGEYQGQHPSLLEAVLLKYQMCGSLPRSSSASRALRAPSTPPEMRPRPRPTPHARSRRTGAVCVQVPAGVARQGAQRGGRTPRHRQGTAAAQDPQARAGRQERAHPAGAPPCISCLLSGRVLDL
eukprot:COSAG01_NODE_2589_length_7411_cov_50.806482_5_plen_180_part_00